MMDFSRRLSDVRKLQSGGEAVVYRALLDGKIPVAVKVYADGNAPNAERFARLDGTFPGVPRFWGAGTLCGKTFAVSEYVVGVPSSRVSPIPPLLAVRMMRRICETLSRSKELGIFHGDLNPENVLVAPSTEPVLVDFGIRGLGAPRFAAPERFEGADANAKSELFALGALLYFWISGEPLFNGDSLESIESAVFRVDLLDVTALLFGRGALSRGEVLAVRDLWKGTLRKNPMERFDEFDEFDENLEIAENRLREIRDESFLSAAAWKSMLAERVRERERRVAESPEAHLDFLNGNAPVFGTKSSARLRLVVKISLLALILLGALFSFIYIGEKRSRIPDVDDVGDSMLENSRNRLDDDVFERRPTPGIRGILVDSDSFPR